MATSAMDQSGIMALPEADKPPQGGQKGIKMTDSYDGYKTALNTLTPESGQAVDTATDQIMEHVDQMSDQQLDALITLLQMMIDHQEAYKDIVKQMIEGGNIEEGEFPPEYDENFIATLMGLLLNAQHMREQSKGAPISQGIGGLPTSMPEGPQGFARGGIAEAVRMVASQGRRGDTMLAHINPTEARMLKSMGGSGTINPATGLHEFGWLQDRWDDVKGAVQSVGNAISGAVKGVVSLAKQIVASPVGRILATVALATFLGPAAMGGIGVFSSTAIAAGVAGGGITLLAGGSLKDAIINGGMAYFAAPGSPVNAAVGQAMGVTAASGMAAQAAAAGVTGLAVGTGGGLLQGKSLKESVQQGLAQGAIAGGMSLAGNAFGKTGPKSPEEAFAAAKNSELPDWYKNGNNNQALPPDVGVDSSGRFTGEYSLDSRNVPYKPNVPGEGNMVSDRYGLTGPDLEVGTGLQAKDSFSGDVYGRSVQQAELYPNNASAPVTSVSNGAAEAGSRPVLDANGKPMVDANGKVLMNNPNYSEAAGQKANTVWQDMKEAGRQLGQGEFGKAWDATADIFAPSGDAGFMRTYAPAIAGGLAITGAMGGYDQKPPPKTELQKAMEQKTLDEYNKVKNNPGDYEVKNQQGVTYDDSGKVINTGGSYRYKEVTPEDTQTDTRQVLGQGPSTYTPPAGTLTNSKGPIAQPYNMYDMYTNLMPQYYTSSPRRAATGGIADLGTSEYPRRNGQISGPGTPTSDSIPAMLSDGEFVMTEKAVTSLGGGDRRAGAKKMYALMHHLERNAARG